MEIIQSWIDYIQNADILFWLGGVVGVIVILLVSAGLKYLGRRTLKKEKAKLLWKTAVNWLTLFIAITYIFTYLTETQWIYTSLFVLGNTNITIFLLLSIIFVVILAVKFSKAIRDYVLPGLYERYELDRGIQATLNTSIHYFIMIIAILFSLNSLGFEMTSLTVFASVLGVGIGFGIQNIMNNFISGIIILFERPMKVGDRIIIDDTIADVEEIKMRDTIVRTRKNERIIIPNSYFLEEKFINRSYANTLLRITVEVGVGYDSDVNQVRDLLIESVSELKEEKWDNILLEPEPRVFFEDFAESELQFKIWFWIDSQTDEREFVIPSDLRFKIFNKFNQHNIEIPFPKRDVQFPKEIK